jgi:hypothetical protein
MVSSLKGIIGSTCPVEIPTTTLMKTTMRESGHDVAGSEYIIGAEESKGGMIKHRGKRKTIESPCLPSRFERRIQLIPSHPQNLHSSGFIAQRPRPNIDDIHMEDAKDLGIPEPVC